MNGGPGRMPTDAAALAVRVAEARTRVSIDDVGEKPMPTTQGQYTRIARARYHTGGEPRVFLLFAQSNLLFDSIHDLRKTPDWIREGFAKKWIYIEEAIRPPRATDDFTDWCRALPPEEDWLWMALFNEFTDAHVYDHFVKIFFDNLDIEVRKSAIDESGGPT